MLASLNLQARSRLKFKRFEVTRNAQCRENGMGVNVASLRHKVLRLLCIRKQAHNHDILPFDDEIASLRKRVEAPFGATHASFDPVSQLGGTTATCRADLIADRRAQSVQAGKRRQRTWRAPCFHIDQLKHVGALTLRRADSLSVAANRVRPREMQGTIRYGDLVATTSRSAIADCRRANSDIGEKNVGAEVTARASLGVGEALHIGDANCRRISRGNRRAPGASQQQRRTDEFSHAEKPSPRLDLISIDTVRRPVLDARQASLGLAVFDAAQRHCMRDGAGT